MRNFLKRKAVVLVLVCTCACFALLAGCNNTKKLPTEEKTTATITYVTGVEGENPAPQTGKIGSKIYPPADPEREGYRFAYWELDGERFEFDIMPEEDITLHAKWNKLYYVYFETGEDASLISPLEFVEGEIIEAPIPPTRYDYVFDGWLLNGEPYEFGEMLAEDLYLTAKWIPLVEIEGLPSMYIELFDENGNTFPLSSVQKENYVDSRISLTNIEDEFAFESLKAEFKGRGNGSWWDIPYDKKGYKIKFDKKQSLFGREANKHWVIIACVSNSFPETTMSRNYLAYNMAAEVFDNIKYTTAAYWIDVYVNGEYRGVYLLCEHVRVGDGRVDIESEYLDSSRDPESTGYLIEYDAYAEGEEGEDYFRIDGVKYPFTLHSPDPEDDEYLDEGVSKAEFRRQVAYIKDYVQRVYTAALTGDWNTFSELADVDSFVDMYILHELFKNTDTGYSSFYLYKKPNGKLYAGPAWDFDGTCNATRGDQSPEGIFVADSVRYSSDYTSSELYIALYLNNSFKSAVKARWKVLSPSILEFLDSRLNDEVYEANKSAMGRNYANWLGKSQTVAENDWVNDVKTLKAWLIARIEWLDNEWK